MVSVFEDHDNIIVIENTWPYVTCMHTPLKHPCTCGARSVSVARRNSLLEVRGAESVVVVDVQLLGAAEPATELGRVGRAEGNKVTDVVGVVDLKHHRGGKGAFCICAPTGGGARQGGGGGEGGRKLLGCIIT